MAAVHQGRSCSAADLGIKPRTHTESACSARKPVRRKAFLLASVTSEDWKTLQLSGKLLLATYDTGEVRQELFAAKAAELCHNRHPSWHPVRKIERACSHRRAEQKVAQFLQRPCAL